jgi:hypothetical protein
MEHFSSFRMSHERIRHPERRKHGSRYRACKCPFRFKIAVLGSELNARFIDHLRDVIVTADSIYLWCLYLSDVSEEGVRGNHSDFNLTRPVHVFMYHQNIQQLTSVALKPFVSSTTSLARLVADLRSVFI